VISVVSVPSLIPSFAWYGLQLVELRVPVSLSHNFGGGMIRLSSRIYLSGPESRDSAGAFKVLIGSLRMLAY